MNRLADWLGELRRGGMSSDLELPEEKAFQPVRREAARLATSLASARAAAEEEARLRESRESIWTPERLRIFVQNKLNGDRLFAVSNREPYEHVRRNGSIECVVPASGLVTALEPVLRACDGTWIAQATGDADRDTVDEHGRVRVPPDHPQYTLRRVWLTKQEEARLLLRLRERRPVAAVPHRAHAADFSRRTIGKRIGRSIASSPTPCWMKWQHEERPVVLVQDYHFALLPRMIKERRPDARVAIFWHIPWPNPEAFGICPWQRELLDGLLGADLIGFHIQAHCNNFLETVDRALESRVDWEHFAVTREGHHHAGAAVSHQRGVTETPDAAAGDAGPAAS